jgi:enoyl-[acyl-carrier protein] reductase II
MAAGGIANHRAFDAAFALGAEGVYCGTAFLMSEESRMAANVKEAVLKANAKDLLLFRTIPAYYRSLPGELANELVAMDKAGATNEELGRKMGGFANLRIGMLEGDMDKGYVSVGNGISHIHEVKSCAEIIAELTKNYKA